MDSLVGTPAMVLGRRTEVLPTNRLARVLLDDFEAMPVKERNYARWMFLVPEARQRLVDWEVQAQAVVETLRLDAGRDPHDPGTQALVGDLTSASPDFARWWEQHRVHQRTHGGKRFRHPIGGELSLQYEALTFPGDPYQTMYLYSAEPNSPSRQALDLLISWSITEVKATVSEES